MRDRGQGVKWGELFGFLSPKLPTTYSDQERGDIAYNLVAEALNEILGNKNWHTFKQENRQGRPVTFVKAGRKSE